MDNSNEDFWVQYYDGSSWNTVAAFARGTDFDNNTFYHATVNFYESSYTFPTDMKIRFMCDASGNRDDVYIDQITVSATTAAASIAKATGPRLEKLETTITLPEKFTLEQNFPNPFNPETNIKYSIPEATHVSIIIYNAFGQKVTELVNLERDAGLHNVTWHGIDMYGNAVSSGIYFYQMNAGKFSAIKKMIFIK